MMRSSQQQLGFFLEVGWSATSFDIVFVHCAVFCLACLIMSPAVVIAFRELEYKTLHISYLLERSHGMAWHASWHQNWVHQ